MTTIPKRKYIVDVASYQPTDVSSYISLGAKAVIVKISEGTNYINPKATGQIASAKKHGVLPMAYFYATFSGNASRARTQASYAISQAKAKGLPNGTFFAVDWENGSGNYCGGSRANNTNAIIEAMKVIKSNGYKPLIYSGAAVLRSNVDINKIIKAFGTCIWVASYATMSAVSTANFGYFPSMNGVAIWQFTSNWHGLSVDASISLIDLSTAGSAHKKASKPKAKEKPKKQEFNLNVHPVCKWDIERVFVVTNHKGAYIYKDKELTKKTKLEKFNTVWKVYGEEGGAIRIGKNAYFDGRAGFTKSNPIAHNANKHAVVKVMLPHTHALTEPRSGCKVAYSLKQGAKYEVTGRVGRFLILKTSGGIKRYVTGNRAFVVL